MDFECLEGNACRKNIAVNSKFSNYEPESSEI